MDKQPVEINIRPATNTDAEGIIASHVSAILGTAAAFYPDEIVKEWADPGNPERLEKFKEFLESKQSVVFVAESSDSIVGFSELVPSYNEVRAVYVASDYGRRGIGSNLLNKLEAEAKKRGIEELRLSSSVNASDFYTKHGYSVDEKTTHKLRSGAEMECYKMHKSLAARY